MTYTITRDGQQYGPYTLSDLQRYVASGEVLLTDMAASEGLGEPVPVSQIIGNIALPVAVAPVKSDPSLDYPNPPNLHWGVVCALALLSRGLFGSVWGLVLALWLKKVDPETKAVYWYGASVGALGFIVLLMSWLMVASSADLGAAMGILILIWLVADMGGRFVLGRGMERHYTGAEEIPMSLSGVMIFFFSTFYLQYHVNQAVRTKRAIAAQMTTGV